MPPDSDAKSTQHHLGKDSQGKVFLNHNIIKPLKLISSPQEILSIKDVVHKEAIYQISKEGSYIGL